MDLDPQNSKQKHTNATKQHTQTSRQANTQATTKQNNSTAQPSGKGARGGTNGGSHAWRIGLMFLSAFRTLDFIFHFSILGTTWHCLGLRRLSFVGRSRNIQSPCVILFERNHGDPFRIKLGNMDPEICLPDRWSRRKFPSCRSVLDLSLIHI